MRPRGASMYVRHQLRIEKMLIIDLLCLDVNEHGCNYESLEVEVPQNLGTSSPKIG